MSVERSSVWKLACVLVCLSCSPADCSCGSRQAEPPVASAADTLEEVMPQPVSDEPEAPEYPKPGFTAVSVDDKGPLCVFPDYEQHFQYKHAEDVGKQTLKAGSTIVIGAFGPWCVHESCDDRPSLQCSADVEGKTIWVHTHYWGDHKDGSTCTEDCRSVTAGCETSVLEAGTYTLQHGENAYKLKIPSVMRNPCFGR